LLLKCRDHIAALVQSASGGESPSIEKIQDVLAAEKHLTDKLNRYLKEVRSQESEVRSQAYEVKSDNYHISLRFAPNVLRDGMDPISFINYLTRLGEIVSITTITDAMPPASEMNPEDCYLGFEIDFKSDFDKKTIEDVFEFVREDASIRILPPKSSIESYLKLIEELIEDQAEDPLKIGEILVKGGALTAAELEASLRLQSEKAEPKQMIGEILVNEGMAHKEVVDAAIEKQKSARDTKAKQSKTIRVDAEKLDYLINMVGELVISIANLGQHAKRVNDSGLQESTSIMSRLVEEIRDAAMKVRMVPIGETFSRFQRVIRDISKEMGKDIDLIISGGETELDKTVVEKINDPLMHIVRNAADHGIESPDERTAKGKRPKGTIRLNAYQDAGIIVIEVSDDGRGVNSDKVFKKAVERGMVSPAQCLSDKEVFNLLFEPGFSTVEQVTKTSGRGVGMDVVKRNVESLRGTVEIESSEGIGTTVRIRLPLTLAIIDGFMVKVGKCFYVIPLDMVVECIELLEAEQAKAKRRHYINLRGNVLPYVRLRELFNEDGVKPLYENIVVVRYAGQKTGLVVDELHGEIQAVIKSLGRLYRDIDGISGATILGDGTVALIIDVPHLVQSAE
jgi:two-component system chemotaxis sensor kinase CheA